jgi:hypothetical protein
VNVLKEWWMKALGSDAQKAYIHEKCPVSTPSGRVAWLIHRHQLALEVALAKAEGSSLTEDQKTAIRAELEGAKQCASLYSEFDKFHSKQSAAPSNPPTTPTSTQPHPTQIDADAPRSIEIEDR